MTPRSPRFCQACDDEIPYQQCGKCGVWLCARCWDEHECNDDERSDPEPDDYRAGGKYSHGFTVR